MVSPAPLTISTAARFHYLESPRKILDAKSNFLGAEEILSNPSRRRERRGTQTSSRNKEIIQLHLSLGGV